jgi:hypothetical protein
VILTLSEGERERKEGEVFKKVTKAFEVSDERGKEGWLEAKWAEGGGSCLPKVDLPQCSYSTESWLWNRSWETWPQYQQNEGFLSTEAGALGQLCILSSHGSQIIPGIHFFFKGTHLINVWF